MKISKSVLPHIILLGGSILYVSMGFSFDIGADVKQSQHPNSSPWSYPSISHNQSVRHIRVSGSSFGFLLFNFGAVPDNQELWLSWELCARAV